MCAEKGGWLFLIILLAFFTVASFPSRNSYEQWEFETSLRRNENTSAMF
jgi:hypothetical protein